VITVIGTDNLAICRQLHFDLFEYLVILGVSEVHDLLGVPLVSVVSAHVEVEEWFHGVNDGRAYLSRVSRGCLHLRDYSAFVLFEVFAICQLWLSKLLGVHHRLYLTVYYRLLD